MRTTIIGAVIAASAAWYVQGLRWDNDVAAIKAGYSTRALNQVYAAMGEWNARNKTNEDAYAQLENSIAGLRGDVGGLHQRFKGLPGYIRDASRESLGDYAATCTAIFERMATTGGEMAEAGARLARQADKHAADAQLAK